jgi:hypothetical protein
METEQSNFQNVFRTRVQNREKVGLWHCWSVLQTVRLNGSNCCTVSAVQLSPNHPHPSDVASADLCHLPCDRGGQLCLLRVCTARQRTSREKLFFKKISWSKKGCPATAMQATMRRGYSSYSFLISALDGGEWSASRPGRALPPVKGPPVPIVQEAEWTPEPVWTQRSLSKIELRSPSRQVCGQTLYCLSYYLHWPSNSPTATTKIARICLCL